jgi:hypothetical protein
MMQVIEGGKMYKYIRLAVVFILSHTFSYVIVGAIAYQLFYKPFWEGPSPLYATFMRTMADPTLWAQAMTWQIPGQILRGLLMALAISPILPKLEETSIARRYAFIAALLFVFAHMAASDPSTGNIEGAIYMRPEFVAQGFLPSQPEMIAHSLLAGFLIARFMFKPAKQAQQVMVRSQVGHNLA